MRAIENSRVSLAELKNRLLPLIEADLRAALAPQSEVAQAFYGMLHYHMGWVDEAGQTIAEVGGKRIRSLLCLLAAAAAANRAEHARCAAAAVELIHNFSLLHDDIEDQSPVRRGRPTVWKIWGIPQAINAGDALFALAHLAITRLKHGEMPEQTTLALMTALDEMCLKLTYGQHLDITFEKMAVVSVETYMEMTAGKSAALFAGAAAMGAIAAEANPKTRGHFEQFGFNLGMAFQARDDVLDIWGSPENTGKLAARDIYQKKKSLPIVFGLSQSADLRDMYEEISAFDETTVTECIRILEGTGAKTFAEGKVVEYSEKAVKHLDAAVSENPAKQALRELTDQLLGRAS